MANKIKNLYKGLNKNNGKDKNSLLFGIIAFITALAIVAVIIIGVLSLIIKVILMA